MKHINSQLQCEDIKKIATRKKYELLIKKVTSKLIIILCIRLWQPLRVKQSYHNDTNKNFLVAHIKYKE